MITRRRHPWRYSLLALLAVFALVFPLPSARADGSSRYEWVATWSQQAPPGQFGAAGIGSLALGPDGNLYVADTSNCRIQVFTPGGEFVRQWGQRGDGAGELWNPAAVAVAPDGTVYVGDTGNCRIQAFTASGEFIRQWGSPGTGDNEFTSLRAIAIGPEGNLYTADSTGSSAYRQFCRIRVFTPAGEFLRGWGRYGFGAGELGDARALAVDASGKVYIADRDQFRVQVWSSEGSFLYKIGQDGGGDGQLMRLEGVAIGPDGNVYVADTENQRVQVFSPAGDYLGQFSVVIPADDSHSRQPSGIVVAGDGTIYVSGGLSYYGNVARIKAFDATGALLRTWGGAGVSDGQLVEPLGLHLAMDGNLYVADKGNHRIQVFASDGSFSQQWGSQGNGEGQFIWPSDVVMGPDGLVYVADAYNLRVQVFTPQGQFVRQWPVGYFGASGIAATADGEILLTASTQVLVFAPTGELIRQWGIENSPGGDNSASDVAYGPDGNVYVLFVGQRLVQVFTPEGGFVRQWGGRCTTWQPSCLSGPTGLAVAPGGLAYVADAAAIKVYSWWGAYLGQWGGAGVGPGQFTSPRTVAVGPDGLIYVSDTGNDRLQVFRYNAPAPIRLPLLLRP